MGNLETDLESERIIYTGLDIITTHLVDVESLVFAETTRFISGDMKLVIAPGTELKLTAYHCVGDNPVSVGLDFGSVQVEVPIEQFLRAKFH